MREHFRAGAGRRRPTPAPSTRARPLLYGEHLRRERRRTAGRAHLRAPPWAERARNELRATGETARRREPGTLDQLTPQELQIARYVAEGLSNMEVAAQLVLSPRTVNARLRNVFAKLSPRARSSRGGPSAPMPLALK